MTQILSRRGSCPLSWMTPLVMGPNSEVELYILAHWVWLFKKRLVSLVGVSYATSREFDQYLWMAYFINCLGTIKINNDNRWIKIASLKYVLYEKNMLVSCTGSRLLKPILSRCRQIISQHVSFDSFKNYGFN